MTEEQSKKEVVITCDGCGEKNTIIFGQVESCKYCRSPLQSSLQEQLLTEKSSTDEEEATVAHPQSRTRVLVSLGLATALIFVITRFLGIPVPHGWLNLGDSAIAASTLLMMHPLVGIAAGVGSALSNLTSPAVIFAPATLVIKGSMGFIMYYFARKGKFSLYAVGIFLAETLMVVGYTAYIFFLFSQGLQDSEGYPATVAALTTLPGNLFQAGANFVLALLLFAPLMRLRKILWGSTVAEVDKAGVQ
jgi:uncharacterized membrane protein